MNNQLINALFDSYKLVANEEFAAWQFAYMRNQFKFLGIKTNDRRDIQKKVFSEYKIDNEDQLINIVELLWNKPEREFHYSAIELISKYKKFWNEKLFVLIEKLIRSNSWWDTVDYLATNILGNFLTKFPEYKSKMHLWVVDENLWIRRSALLFQLKYKKNTDEEILFSYCRKLASHKDFFIKKAIGWVLREYSKTDKVAVKKFIDENKATLSGLSIREGSKYL